MLELIDRLAGWWLDWRVDRRIANDPELQKAGFKRAEVDENGFHLVLSFPGVYLLADEAAAMLEAHNAKNYVQFDMLPRADRQLEPIRVTVQWAKGKSPAQRVLELESVWIDAVNLYPDLEVIMPLCECGMGSATKPGPWHHKDCPMGKVAEDAAPEQFEKQVMEHDRRVIPELVSALIGMVQQHCGWVSLDLVGTSGLSSDEEAIYLLERLGYLEQVSDKEVFRFRTHNVSYGD